MQTQTSLDPFRPGILLKEGYSFPLRVAPVGMKVNIFMSGLFPWKVHLFPLMSSSAVIGI